MLLDTYTLQQTFTSLLTLPNSNPNNPKKPSKPPPPPAGYLKRVTQSTSRISPLLKTLQVRPQPPEALVQAYLIHIADKSDANFRKILDLKGLKKADQTHLLELFVAHRSSPRNESLQANSPVLTPLGTAGGGVGGSISTPSGMIGGSLSQAASLSTSNLPARFDPGSFGSALMTAARDGVGFATPGLGSSASVTPAGSRLASPPPSEGRRAMSPDPGGKGNLNENLRNIGKFFKRDVAGGFGGRFGRSEEG